MSPRWPYQKSLQVSGWRRQWLFWSISMHDLLVLIQARAAPGLERHTGQCHCRLVSSGQALRGDPVLPGHSDLESAALCVLDIAGVSLPWGPSSAADPFEVCLFTLSLPVNTACRSILFLCAAWDPVRMACTSSCHIHCCV